MIHVIGFGFIAFLLGLVSFYPESEWTQALLTTYGVRGSGPDGRVRRRDHLRGALVALVLTIVCLAVSVLAFSWAESYPGMSRSNWTLSAYGFSFFLLAGVSLLAAGGAAWRSIFPPAGPKERESPEDSDEPIA